MVRFIGDVHGKLRNYIFVAKHAEYSVQIGDMNTGNYQMLYDLDPSKHFVVAGNHDNYARHAGRYYMQSEHFLGDFGIKEIPNFGSIYYVRGGLSIDKHFRVRGLNWWAEEELSRKESNKLLDHYRETKPDFVVSHECPEFLIKDVSSMTDKYIRENFRVNVPSYTSQLLQQLWDIHQPNTWIFGHYHNNFTKIVEGTKFICLAELSFLDFENKEQHGKITSGSLV